MELSSKENPINYSLFWLPQVLSKRTCQQVETEKCVLARMPTVAETWERTHFIAAALLHYLLTVFWNVGLLEASSIVVCSPISLWALVPLQRHNIFQATCLYACLFMLVFENRAKIRSLFSWLGTHRDALNFCCFLEAPNHITGMSCTSFNLNIKLIYVYFLGTFRH